MLLKQFFLILVTLIISSNGANIFCIFATPAVSHQAPLLAISKALAAKGHNVTVITPDPSKVPIKNHREIDISFLYKMWQAVQAQQVLSVQKQISGTDIALDFFPAFVKFVSTNTLKSPEIQSLIREINGTVFDAMIYETYYYSSLLGFGSLIGNPPVIGVMSVNQGECADLPVGNPIIPSYVPNFVAGFGHKMTFFERAMNLWGHLIMLYAMETRFGHQQELLNEYFPNVRQSAKELEYNKSLLLVTTDLSTTYPRPLQPNTIFVGPTHLQTSAKPLPEDLQKWMDEAEEGVIYFSLGSNMKGTSVPEEKRSAFIKSFLKFPKVRVIWKWEADDELPGKPNNVLVKKWLPQRSILAHPKLKIFISQVGMQSFQESINNGVPILGIPMFADQEQNSKKVASAGAGLIQDFNEITYDSVYTKLKDMLTNTSYKENMLRLTSISKDKPMSNLDTAIWWIEYVVRHKGAPHLRPYVLELTWYQYIMLDIILSIFAVVATISCIVFYVIKRIVSNPNAQKIKTN